MRSQWGRYNLRIYIYIHYRYIDTGYIPGIYSEIPLEVPGWRFQPLLVTWDDYSQYMEKIIMFQTTNQVLLIFMNKKKWFSHGFSGAAFVTSDISKVTFRCKATIKSSFRWPGFYRKHANFTRKNGDLLRKTMCFKGQTKNSPAKWLWFGCQVGWNPNCCWVLWVTGI